jgi:hypothetical protein
MICDRRCFECRYEDCLLPETADVNEQKAKWRRNNPEKARGIRRKYYLGHRESEIKYQKAYYTTHKQQLNSRPRNLVKKRAADNRYSERNREKRRLYAAAYRARKRERQAG